MVCLPPVRRTVRWVILKAFPPSVVQALLLFSKTTQSLQAWYTHLLLFFPVLPMPSLFYSQSFCLACLPSCLSLPSHRQAGLGVQTGEKTLGPEAGEALLPGLGRQLEWEEGHSTFTQAGAW